MFETALQEVSGNCQLAVPYWYVSQNTFEFFRKEQTFNMMSTHNKTSLMIFFMRSFFCLCSLYPFQFSSRDWERDAGNEGDSDVFDESNFGRFECGGRAGWNNQCTERSMGRGTGGAGGRNFAGEAELLTLITRDSSFADFAPALEGRPHSVVHWFVGTYKLFLLGCRIYI